MSQLMEKPGTDSDVPEGISVLHILDNTGDTRIMWDPTKADEVEIAHSAFDAAKRKGMLAYTVNQTGEKGEVVGTFDKTQAKLIMTPQLQGG